MVVALSKYAREKFVNKIANITGKIEDKDLLGWEDFYFRNYRGKYKSWLISMSILLGMPTLLIIAYMILYGILYDAGQAGLINRMLSSGCPYIILAISYLLACVLGLYYAFTVYEDWKSSMH
jgi:hypothetical protein